MRMQASLSLSKEYKDNFVIEWSSSKGCYMAIKYHSDVPSYRCHNFCSAICSRVEVATSVGGCVRRGDACGIFWACMLFPSIHHQCGGGVAVSSMVISLIGANYCIGFVSGQHLVHWLKCQSEATFSCGPKFIQPSNSSRCNNNNR